MIEWLREYAVLFVGVAGVGIAWGQWYTARTKLILDLYDKRRAVYSAFHGPIGDAVRQGRSDLANFFEYSKVLDEAKFLFGRDVLEYTKQIRDTLNRLGEASSMLQHGAEGLSEDERLAYLRRQRECMSELSEFWERLERLMAPDMLMERKRPFSLTRTLRKTFWFE